MTDVLEPPVEERIANPYRPLQIAVVDRLRADPDLARKGVKTLDFVNEDEEGPYIVFESAWLAERDALRTPIDPVWFQLSIFSPYRGYAEVNELADDVEDCLRHLELPVPGFGLVHLLREQSHLTRSPDGRWRRLAVTFHSPYIRALRGPTPPTPPLPPGEWSVVILGSSESTADLPPTASRGDGWLVGADLWVWQ